MDDTVLISVAGMEESLLAMDGSGVDDMNPKPDEGESALPSPAPASAATGDGISIFDAVVVVAVCSSGVAVGVCMKLKLDAAGAAAAVSLLASLEGEPLPPRKEKALEGDTAGSAVTAGTGAATSWLSCDAAFPPAFIKENPDEGGSATAGAGAGAGAGSGVDMKEKALLAGAAAAASDAPVSSFFLSGVALTSKPPNILSSLVNSLQ
jgi:hypothetical protein